MPPLRQAWCGGAWPTTWGPVPRLLLCLGTFWSRAEAQIPIREGPVLPLRGWGVCREEVGGGVEGGGGDREAVAVSRPWAAGAVMLRDPPLPRRRNHAGPLRLCAATDQNPGAHPGRPPVPPLRSPRFRPRAARRQLPRPAGPLEAACAPKDGQSLVSVAPRHRLAINSLRTSSSLISISWAGGLGGRGQDGALDAGGLPGGEGLQLCPRAPGRAESPKFIPVGGGSCPRSPPPRPVRSSPCCHPDSSAHDVPRDRELRAHPFTPPTPHQPPAWGRACAARTPSSALEIASTHEQKDTVV